MIRGDLPRSLEPPRARLCAQRQGIATVGRSDRRGTNQTQVEDDQAHAQDSTAAWRFTPRRPKSWRHPDPTQLPMRAKHAPWPETTPRHGEQTASLSDEPPLLVKFMEPPADLRASVACTNHVRRPTPRDMRALRVIHKTVLYTLAPSNPSHLRGPNPSQMG